MDSEQVNYVVWRYLKESGYDNTAYAFDYETKIEQADRKWNESCPTGALIRALQKGLQYMELEQHYATTTDDTEATQCTSSFSLVEQHVCAKKNDVSSPMDADLDATQSIKLESDEQHVDSSDTTRLDKDLSYQNALIDVAAFRCYSFLSLPSVNATFTCSAWAYKDPYKLCIGSSDSQLRVFDLSPTLKDKSAYDIAFQMSVSETGQDITGLHWNHCGTFLACTYFIGLVQLFNDGFSLITTIQCQDAPILSACWSPTDTFLLLGLADGSFTLWDAYARLVKHTVQQPQNAPILDLAWLNAEHFVTVDAIGNLTLYTVENEAPVFQIPYAHLGSISSVEYSPYASLLLTASADASIKLWSIDADYTIKLISSIKLPASIDCIQWSPSEPSLFAVSSSGSICLYNAFTRNLLYRLRRNRTAITKMSFSHNGRYLASGDLHGNLHIWRYKNASLVGEYISTAIDKPNATEEASAIRHLNWNRTDEILAAGNSTDLIVLSNNIKGDALKYEH
ncbi:Set3 complex subunit Hif2 [Schizosaccharomyces japonicus yFS275]|uniref:Set3 complex subunit Hif2 n=1 Tax=Schizosaccharomyces japonicus (strain yFS275 / FY16936) TaxID=402676 RepID=B6JZ99_SCHJY|nr:Set3 complex subunit Hif2 [Schizosaccharomyces japonicus yFS275]EEB06867.1 Set3 complex subunit Hif2 [Schizosaccharomyces japonicus yFS275]